jgi:signal transduction histidine kinase
MESAQIIPEAASAGRSDVVEPGEARLRALVDFLIDLSHELRTPLNGILGFAELMHDGKVGPLSPLHREYLGDILTSARQLHLLINEVLERARVEADLLEAQPDREPSQASCSVS